MPKIFKAAEQAGTPSMVFDAVASVLSPTEGGKLARASTAVAWFANAYAQLKAMAAGTRPSAREPKVRTSA